MPQLQRWTTAAALAEYLGVHYRTVIRWTATGALRATELPPHYSDTRPRTGQRRARLRLYEADVTAFLEQLRAGTKPPAALWRTGH